MKKLNKDLSDDRVKQKAIHKLLLLGAGESGKSTLFKQMIKLYGPGFTDHDRRDTYVELVHSNVIGNIKSLLSNTKNYGQLEEKNEHLRAIMMNTKPAAPLTPELAQQIAALWADPVIQAAYANRTKFQLNESCAYFMDQLHILSSPDYLPSDHDIMAVRIKTTGILSNEFTISENKFQMFDVGGQRNERKKWIHCFEGVTAVFFRYCPVRVQLSAVRR